MLIGRRWFDRTYGNTYHSVAVYVDGVCVHKVPFSYGYGDQWQWTGAEWLEQNGYLPGRRHSDNGGCEPLWQYCKRRKITFSYDVSDVTRKRDL